MRSTLRFDTPFSSACSSQMQCKDVRAYGHVWECAWTRRLCVRFGSCARNRLRQRCTYIESILVRPSRVYIYLDPCSRPLVCQNCLTTSLCVRQCTYIVCTYYYKVCLYDHAYEWPTKRGLITRRTSAMSSSHSGRHLNRDHQRSVHNVFAIIRVDCIRFSGHREREFSNGDESATRVFMLWNVCKQIVYWFANAILFSSPSIEGSKSNEGYYKYL